MGSPISPLLANLFMEEFEVKAINTTPTPHLWLRYVDDTFVIQQAEHSHQLLQHLNSQDPHIQFTMEDPNQDGTLPFLDTLVSPGLDTITTLNRNLGKYHQPHLWDE